MSLSVGDGDGGVFPQVNKFEQVFSDDHQMSLAGGGYGQGVGMSGGGGLGMSRGGLPPTMYHMIHVMSPTPSPPDVNRQTSVKTLPSRNYRCERIKWNPDLNFLYLYSVSKFVVYNLSNRSLATSVYINRSPPPASSFRLIDHRYDEHCSSLFLR